MIRTVSSFLIVVILSFTMVQGAEAAEPRISGFHLKGKDRLTVSFRIEEGFKKDIEEAILSGIPTTFTFFVEVQRRRWLWWDEKLGALRFKHTVRYDNLKEEFTVFLEEANRKIKVKDMKSVKMLMVEVKDLPLPVSRPLQEGRPYYVKVKAELKTIKLPFPLRYILFFASFLDFKTDWYVKTFTIKDGKVIISE